MFILMSKIQGRNVKTVARSFNRPVKYGSSLLVLALLVLAIPITVWYINQKDIGALPKYAKDDNSANSEKGIDSVRVVRPLPNSTVNNSFYLDWTSDKDVFVKPMMGTTVGSNDLGQCKDSIGDKDQYPSTTCPFDLSNKAVRAGTIYLRLLSRSGEYKDFMYNYDPAFKNDTITVTARATKSQQDEPYPCLSVTKNGEDDKAIIYVDWNGGSGYQTSYLMCFKDDKAMTKEINIHGYGGRSDFYPGDTLNLFFPFDTSYEVSNPNYREFDDKCDVSGDIYGHDDWFKYCVNQIVKYDGNKDIYLEKITFNGETVYAHNPSPKDVNDMQKYSMVYDRGNKDDGSYYDNNDWGDMFFKTIRRSNKYDREITFKSEGMIDGKGVSPYDPYYMWWNGSVNITYKKVLDTPIKGNVEAKVLIPSTGYYIYNGDKLSWIKGNNVDFYALMYGPTKQGTQYSGLIRLDSSKDSQIIKGLPDANSSVSKRVYVTLITYFKDGKSKMNEVEFEIKKF